MRKFLYIGFVVSFMVVVISPLLLLRLFDYGCWMVFCYAIYYVIFAVYLAFTQLVVETIGSEYGKIITPERTSSFVAFFAATSFACLIPIIAFPLLSVSEEFLFKINHLFGMHLTTTYEGGMIVIMMFVGGLCLLIGYASSIFPILGKILKTEFKKSSIFGIVSSVVLFMCLYGAFLYGSKDVSYNYNGSFNTQIKQEEREMDYRIESEKSRMIQKSVDDYNKQWNN